MIWEDVIFIALYSNSTHIYQPMDVAVFHSRKEGWKKKVYQLRLNHESPRLKKEGISLFLKEVVDKKYCIYYYVQWIL